MRNSSVRPSTTSLPPSPDDDAATRTRRYLITMAVRIVCFILMVVITPYGWYTAVFGAVAIFLPYIAVVMANAGDDVHEKERQSPERALTGTPEPVTPTSPPPTVIQVQETRAVDDGGSDRA